MYIDNSPARVGINIDQPNYLLSEEELQTILFITSDKNVEYNKAIICFDLKNLLNAGYRRDSIAYNFCFGVFLQKKGMRVVLINKPPDISYVDFYSKKISKHSHYFICIESKEPKDVVSLDDYLKISKLEKLIFTSTNKDFSKEYANCERVVYYYLSGFDFDDFFENYILLDSGSITQTDEADNLILNRDLNNINSELNEDTLYVSLDSESIAKTDGGFDLIFSESFVENTDIDVYEAQGFPLYYPESAWISRCAKVFPSKIQWLYKSFSKQITNQSEKIPDNSTTSIVFQSQDIATSGCGKTSNLDMTIDERISLDWLCIAIRKKLWSVLYTDERIKADKNGESKLTASLVGVLDKAIDLEILKSWKSLEIKLNRESNTIGYQLLMQTNGSLLSINVDGNVYY